MTAPGQEDGWLDSAYEDRYEADLALNENYTDDWLEMAGEDDDE